MNKRWKTIRQTAKLPKNVPPDCHILQRGRIVAHAHERRTQLSDRAPPLPQGEPLPLPDHRAGRQVQFDCITLQ